MPRPRTSRSLFSLRVLAITAALALSSGLVVGAGRSLVEAQTAAALEVSTTCLVVGVATPVIVWGSSFPSTSTVTVEPTAEAPATVTPDPAEGHPAGGSFLVRVSVVGTTTTGGAFRFRASQGDLSVFSPLIYVLGPGACPAPSTPTTCVSIPPASSTIPVTVTGLRVPPGSDFAMEGYTARFYLDYHAPDPVPASPPTATVTKGTVSATITAVAPPTPPYPEGDLVTVRLDPPTFRAAVAAPPPPQFVSFFIPRCLPPPTTTTAATTPPTTRPPPGSTTTGAPGSSTTSTAPGPVVTPLLGVYPYVGPDGFVTTARGSGFPPGATVTLQWSPGIGSVVVRAGPDGSFVTPVLILPRDVLGPRTLVALGFPTATAGFLVEPGSAGPPRSGGEWIFRG